MFVTTYLRIISFAVSGIILLPTPLIAQKQVKKPIEAIDVPVIEGVAPKVPRVTRRPEYQYDRLGEELKAKEEIRKDQEKESGDTSSQDVAKPEEESKKSESGLKDYFGANYFSFLWGPGVDGRDPQLPRALTGSNADSGLNAFNLISMRLKITKRLALDLQLRNQLMFTGPGNAFRHQGQRPGISGVFAKGDDWSFSGAINTDLPIPGYGGQMNEQRTQIINPGMFAFFSYAPKTSDYSFFMMLLPRYWIYSDINAVSQQDELMGGLKNKPEYILWLNPSINRKINDKVGLRLGATLQATKYVGFDSVRRDYMPFDIGVTYSHNEHLNFYGYVSTSTPLDDDLRAAQGFGDRNWTESASFQMWVSGNLY